MPRTKHIAMPLWLTRTLLIGLGSILLLMPVHAFISTWGGTAIGPLWLWKSWKEILLVLLATLTIGWLATKPGIVKRLARKPLVITIVAYIALTGLLSSVYWSRNGSEASLAALAMNLRYIGIGALAYLLFMHGQLSGRWVDKAQWFVVCAGVFVAVLGMLQVLIVPPDALAQFGYDDEKTIAPAVLIDDNPDLLRAFATLRGPNDFGAFLILPILIVASRIRQLPRWVSITMLTFMGTALLLSSSRSAWIGLVAAVIVLACYIVGKRVSKLVFLGVGAALVVLAALLFYASTSVPILRQAIFHSSPGDPSLTEGSTDNHIAATFGGVGRVIMQPLGCGPGCAGPASYYGDEPKISENYFVQIAEEVGVVGLVFFLIILGITLYKLHHAVQYSLLGQGLVAAAVGYIVIGMLLHVWSDDPLSITWWMLAGAVIGYNESNQWTKSKNNSRSRTSYSS